VHKLAGGNGLTKVRVYGSFGRTGGPNGIRTPEEMGKIAADFVNQGYKTIKARMQIRQLNIDPDPDPTYETIKAVRKAIGDDIELFVDFNNGYTPSRAITIAKKLIEHFNVAAIEEPVSYLNYQGLNQVVEALDIPIFAGEHEFNRWQIRDLVTIGNADFINADLIKAGGFSECRKMAFIAHAFDKYIMTHNTRPTLATAASLQLCASIPNAARVQEYAGQRVDLDLSHLFEGYFDFKDGYLLIPQIPGLGLNVIEEAMEKSKLN
ncbi:MAG: mandelate racemase/muconate lactonizing enzyme family protein, partial [Melioribacteraceae bacterium]